MKWQLFTVNRVSVVMCMDRRHCGGGGGGGVQSPNYWQKQIVMTLNNIQMEGVRILMVIIYFKTYRHIYFLENRG